jgi:ribosomal protein L34E
MKSRIVAICLTITSRSINLQKRRSCDSWEGLRVTQVQIRDEVKKSQENFKCAASLKQLSSVSRWRCQTLRPLSTGSATCANRANAGQLESREGKVRMRQKWAWSLWLIMIDVFKIGIAKKCAQWLWKEIRRLLSSYEFLPHYSSHALCTCAWNTTHL